MNQLVPTDLRQRIDQLLTDISNDQWQLGKHFVQLGTSLIEVRRTKAWKQWSRPVEQEDGSSLILPFDSFNRYLGSIKDRVAKGRSQLYACITVAENLLPVVPVADIEEMGITKASQLAPLVRLGHMPSRELIEKAKDRNTTVAQVRAEVFELAHIKGGEIERGKYWDLGAIYVSKDEAMELNRAIEVACRVDPVIPMNWPDHARRKEAFLRMAREFLATYEALVEAGTA